MNSSKTVSKKSPLKFRLGIDVGSTTVKCVLVEAESLKIVWSDYQRHETRQAEKLLEMLHALEAGFDDFTSENVQAYITGSGASSLQEAVGASFVQEVNAVALAVEKLHPDAQSVVELGGQDAKIILFETNPETGERQIITSMNDKCASGTGATIDKCILKVGMPVDDVAKITFNHHALHSVAAKCGVFAETDIVNLLKSSVPSEEIMCSLADAIVMQNLTVLTRGNTLKSKVVLLGGPNCYLPFLQECWRLRIPQTWKERGYTPEHDLTVDEHIIVPDNAQYFAAFGAIVFGSEDNAEPVKFNGSKALSEFIEGDRSSHLAEMAGPSLVKSKQDYDDFIEQYKPVKFVPADLTGMKKVEAYIGIDGGSTSSKAVMIDTDGEILKTEYQLSKGNPIQDSKELLSRLKSFANQQNCELVIKGLGATGYAADVLEKTIGADANLVETIAHMVSATKYCGDDIDVICDVGGQDIKVLFLENQAVKSFRLSNQCSAGNGMLLQAMADQFGIDINDYAKTAFGAGFSPDFTYGCAVFLDTDRVNFQKDGYSKQELFAGLARVLPKNIWQYVVQIPRMAEFGTKYVLQGGTQYNQAALKAQVDYIKERVPNAEVLLHPYNGEAGAIGAALEAKRVVERRGSSTFIGLDKAINLEYTTRTDETTRCDFCENSCSRTFIDTVTPDGDSSRYIAGFACEKGTVESKEAVVALNKERRSLKKRFPNMVDYESNLLFKSFYEVNSLPENGVKFMTKQPKKRWFGLAKSSTRIRAKTFNGASSEVLEKRKDFRIGIPRVLNVYMLAPFMRHYLEALGLSKKNIVFSDQTSEELWKQGGKYGSIDPCFPSKVAQAHIHNLLTLKQRRHALDAIWFPCITHTINFVNHTIGNSSCPIVAGTPNVIKASFTKEKNFFGDVDYLDKALDFEKHDVLAMQLFDQFKDVLGLTEDENRWAVEQGLQAFDAIDEVLQAKGLELLQKAEKENTLLLLLIGRPYHSDPGLNHEILEEFQALGYPTLSIRSIPKSEAYLKLIFEKDIDAGIIEDCFDIRDVWPENYSSNSSQKVWAAKFAARHRNVAVLDLSNFKCGHDAPTYAIIDKIISRSKTPYLAMHDIDANKPTGSIKIRVKTYAYSLLRYQEKLSDDQIHSSHPELFEIKAELPKNLMSNLEALEEEYFNDMDEKELIATQEKSDESVIVFHPNLEPLNQEAPIQETPIKTYRPDQSRCTIES